MGSSSSKQTKPALQAMKRKIDPDILMGNWYVQGVIPTPFEIGASNCLENYSWTNKEKKELKVVFKYVQKKKDQVMYQDGYVYNKDTGAEWRVRPRFFGGTIPVPMWLPFLVLDCPSEEQPDYPMVVGYPDRSYLWIMTRKTNMDENLYNKVVERCKTEWEYDTAKVIKVEQNWPTDAQ
jgi:apolipoprotein D and lipocalin family protein